MSESWNLRDLGEPPGRGKICTGLPVAAASQAMSISQSMLRVAAMLDCIEAQARSIGRHIV